MPIDRKANYCLTRNGEKYSIVDTLEAATYFIGSASVSVENGEYVVGRKVGELVRYDSSGTRFSVCRVSDVEAARIRREESDRHEALFAQLLSTTR